MFSLETNLTDQRSIADMKGALQLSNPTQFGKMQALEKKLQASIGIKLCQRIWTECVNQNGKPDGFEILALEGKLKRLQLRLNEDAQKVHKSFDFALHVKTKSDLSSRSFYLNHVVRPFLRDEDVEPLENIKALDFFFKQRVEKPTAEDQPQAPDVEVVKGTWDSIVDLVSTKDDDSIFTVAMRVVGIFLMVVLFPLTILTYFASPLIDSCRGIEVVESKEEPAKAT